MRPIRLSSGLLASLLARCRSLRICASLASRQQPGNPARLSLILNAHWNKELVIENTRGQSYLPVDSESSGKHRLLDIADVFVYSLARSLTPGRQLKCTNLPEAHIEAFGAPGEEWVVG